MDECDDYLEVPAGHADIIQKYIDELHRKVHDEDVIVLKGHLLIEDVLNEIVEVAVRNARFLREARLRFHQKVALARAMEITNPDSATWDVILALNTLRNDLAHALSSDKREARFDVLKECYFRVLNDPAEVESEKTLPDKEILHSIVAFCLGFVGTLRNQLGMVKGTLNAVDNVFRVTSKKPDPNAGV